MNAGLRSRANIVRAVAVFTGLALALGLTACGGGPGNGPGPVQRRRVIGNSLPLSGASKPLGESGRKAAGLALVQIERATAAAGAHQTVRTVSGDQGPDPQSATESARQLVEGDRATCLTGPWSADAVAQTAQDVAIPSKVLEITPTPTGTDIADLNDHDLLNSTALPESVEGSALAKAIEEDLGGAQGHTVNVAASDGAYGDTLSQDFVKEWQHAHGTIGGPTVLASASPDYSDQAQEITTGSPSATLLIDGLDGFSRLAPALSSTRSWEPNTAWGSDRLVAPGLPRQVGAGTVDGMRALAPGAPTDSAASAAFAQAFASAAPHDVKAAPFAAQEFDATVLCYLAAVAAGSTDGQKMADHLIDITAPGGEQFTWQQLPEAVKALENGEDIDYTGASGPIDMDVHGDPTAGVFDVYRYSGEALDVVGQVSVEAPNPATP
jgi:ABC-type branched-subunit amino acid transport system substrate-binding protein